MKPRVLLAILMIVGVPLSACAPTPTQLDGGTGVPPISTAVATLNSDVASLGPALQTACAGGAWADATFQAIAGVTKLSPATQADEQKAVAALDTLCAAPPSDIVSASATAIALIKEIQNHTPAVSTEAQTAGSATH